jgi:hypothetical protein
MIDVSTTHATEAGAGVSIVLAVVSIVKTPIIVALAGEYLPVLQSCAAIVAVVCGLIVISKEIFKSKTK